MFMKTKAVVAGLLLAGSMAFAAPLAHAATDAQASDIEIYCENGVKMVIITNDGIIVICR